MFIGFVKTLLWLGIRYCDVNGPKLQNRSLSAVNCAFRKMTQWLSVRFLRSAIPTYNYVFPKISFSTSYILVKEL